MKNFFYERAVRKDVQLSVKIAGVTTEYLDCSWRYELKVPTFKHGKSGSAHCRGVAQGALTGASPPKGHEQVSSPAPFTTISERG